MVDGRVAASECCCSFSMNNILSIITWRLPGEIYSDKKTRLPENVLTYLYFIMCLIVDVYLTTLQQLIRNLYELVRYAVHYTLVQHVETHSRTGRSYNVPSAISSSVTHFLRGLRYKHTNKQSTSLNAPHFAAPALPKRRRAPSTFSLG